MASQLSDLMAAAPQEPAKAPEPSAPTAKPVEPTPAPTPKVDAAKPAPAAKPSPAVAPKPINIDDPKVPAAELRKHLKDVETRFTATVAEKENALALANAQLKELQAKKFWTPELQKRIDETDASKAALERQLYSKNYAESPEFKKLFKDKIDEQATEAVEVIAALKVQSATGETRDGTHGDMLRLYNAANNTDRRKLAKELFGEDFQEALDAVQPMIATRKAASEAVKSKADSYETEVKQQSEQFQQLNQQMKDFVSKSTESLATAMPAIFGASDKPEEVKMLKKGFEDFDQTSEQLAAMTSESKAATLAAIRAKVAAFGRLKSMVESRDRMLAERDAELAKYRKSDPGNAGEATGATESPKGEGGTAGLSSEWEGLGQ